MVGIARIFTCSPGIAKLVLGEKWDDTELPECFQMTANRLAAEENAQSQL